MWPRETGSRSGSLGRMAGACAPRSMGSIGRGLSKWRTRRRPRNRCVSRLREHLPMKHVGFAGRLVVLGFGSIGQGVLPLILRHIDLPRERIAIVSGDPRGRDVAAENGISFTVTPLTRDNLR